MIIFNCFIQVRISYMHIIYSYISLVMYVFAFIFFNSDLGVLISLYANPLRIQIDIPHSKRNFSQRIQHRKHLYKKTDNFIKFTENANVV